MPRALAKNTYPGFESIFYSFMYFNNIFSGQGNRITSFLVFFFLFSLLSTKDYYSYFAGALVVFSLWKISEIKINFFEKSEKIILISIFLFSLFGFIATFWHGFYIRGFEVPLKFLLAMAVIVCLIRFPPKQAFFWLGLVLGSVSGFFIAVLKMLETGEFKAFGYTGAIQFGNLALTMAVFLLAGLAWVFSNKIKNRKLWAVLLIIGAISGLMGSYFSGTRGGWVAIPLFVFLFSLAYVRRKNLILSSVYLVVLCTVVGGFAYQSPLVTERIKQARQDILEYRENGLSSSSSLGARFAIWQASWDMLKDRPILGLGEEDFRKGLEERARAGQVGAVPASLANTHNTFLEVWVWYGSFSLLFLMTTLISSALYFLSYIRHSDGILRTYALCGLCLIGGYFLYGQTQIMLIRNNTLLFFLISLSCLISFVSQRRDFILKPHS